MGENELAEDAEVRKAGTRVFTVVNVWGENEVDDKLRAFVWNRYVRDHLGGPRWENQDLANMTSFWCAPRTRSSPERRAMPQAWSDPAWER